MDLVFYKRRYTKHYILRVLLQCHSRKTGTELLLSPKALSQVQRNIQTQNRKVSFPQEAQNLLRQNAYKTKYGTLDTYDTSCASTGKTD